LNNNLQAQTPRVFYEIFIRSFCDSNNDGKGDLNGITSKLDYLQYLGIEGIWITPFFRSNSYHKYDVIDYKSVDPECGTMGDLENLVREAHKRNIKVLIDFVINHTSSQHWWFQEAKKGKENQYRNYYNWLSPAQIKAKGIAEREATADSAEKQPWHWANKGDDEKYYGMFWSEMPDLNMDNPKVREEIYEIGRFWLEKGVDGFRMDAAKHIYPDWEADKCHAFWEEFRARMEAIKPDVYIVGEVWTSAEKIAPFFRGLKANFNFDLCFAIQDIVKTGKDGKDIVSMLSRNYTLFSKENPHFVDATMLSNHDQVRIGSIADGNIEKLKMAANLLFTLPGNPYLYYGEEIGMKGKKPDENIREAFIWNKRHEDKDRTNWRKPVYNTDSKTTPLKLQIEDENSLFNHYRKLIALRKSVPALAQISPPNLQKSSIINKKVVSFIRPHENGDVLVIQNITSENVEVLAKEKVADVFFSTKVSKLEGQKAKLDAYGILVLKIG
jgi:alpha-amylase